MTIDLIVVGKTDSEAVAAITDGYLKRVNFHLKCSMVMLPDVRTTRKIPAAQQKKLEGEAILRNVSAGDCVVLLDEKGTEFRSVEFAGWLQKRMNSGVKRLLFVIGGPYGFSEEVYARADARLSLSRMTFSHQIVRAIFTEQLYRALSILAGEPYHHE